MIDKISIIIPVYNAEEYLPRCLNSIMDQTYQNLEILLINDGSTDLSGEICDSFSEKDGRFKVVHKENEGTSSARNQGLKLATGTYIGFIDCDDYIRPTMYEKLIACAIEKQVDLVTCQYETNNGRVVSFDSCENETELSINRYLENLKNSPHGVFNVWNKIFKSDLAKSCSFIHGKIHQDALYISEILLRINKISCIKEELYVYNMDNLSVTRSKYSARRVQGIQVVIEAFKNFSRSAKEYNAREALRIWFVEFLYGHVYKLSVNRRFDVDNTIRKELIDLIKFNRRTGEKDLRFFLAKILPPVLYGFIYTQYLLIRKVLSR